MRIGIREQLAGLVLLSSLIPLAVLAIATWVNNYNFVVNITSQSLSLVASLKAAQIASDLLLVQATCSTIVTRILLQSSLKSYYRGNQTADNWATARNDISSALASGGLSSLLQTRVFSVNSSGNPYGLFNVTADLGNSPVILPTLYPNGTNITLGDPGLGYPVALYPNITYNGSAVTAFNDFPLNSTSLLLLGPFQVNSSFALISLTLPIVDNTDRTTVLGFMTVAAAATSLINVMLAREGLGNTGSVLLVGPNRRENLFKYQSRPATATHRPSQADLESTTVHYVFPPVQAGQLDRHATYNANLSSYGTSNFTEKAFPAIVQGFGNQNSAINNASSILSTHNEEGISVSVGYARPQSSLVDWLLIVEQSHEEAWRPVNHLRNIILACVFGTIGVVLIVVVPLAHYSVRPIRRLRDATEKSVSPPDTSPTGSFQSGFEGDGSGEELGDEAGDEENGLSHRPSKKGFLVRLRNLRPRVQRSSEEQRETERKKIFRIPATVPERKHWISDEVSELTTTFNAMSRQLLLQYTSLEEKVAERTEELELSKKAAEAANESKTLFIANISHELKTPLNGILGMCAVCLGEDDLPRIKRSLQIIYKSGDLLLHLLNDLLTFSKNQIGQQLSLEEKEFRLVDIKSQIITIFEKQVREGDINLKVRFIDSDSDPDQNFTDQKTLTAMAPSGGGRLKDMSLWGDQHRILQVLINLVSNSLKFTPEGGKVDVRIKCLRETEVASDEGRRSLGQKRNSLKKRIRNGSESNTSQVSRDPSESGSKVKPTGTALHINPLDHRASPRSQARDRTSTPPPQGTRTFMFQFEVEDSGPGIPLNFQERVFEPFVQGDLGLNKKHGGTGLGLSICSQLAGLMGGDISLVSAEGKGTTFTMCIPLRHVKSRAASTSSSDARGQSRPVSMVSQSPEEGLGRTSLDGASSMRASPMVSNSPMKFQKDTQPRLVGLSQPFFAATPSPIKVQDAKEQLEALNNAAHGSSTKLRVLVAEDNLVNQEVVLRMLKLEDIYDVVIAKDGQEAYDLVKASMELGQFFNVIFMDIQMPNLDGLQSTRLIRQMGYSAPIVALTAFAEESNVKECYDSGMDEFLSKPIRRPALKQVLKKFSTIIEEAETTSSTYQSTPELSSGATGFEVGSQT